MRVNEFMSEGVADSIRTSMYRNLGIGGDTANELAAKQNFVNRFKQQVKLNQQAGKAAGGFGTNELQQMVDSYLSQYGWVANESDRNILSTFIQKNDIDALANQMYMVGSKQMRDPRSGAVIDPSKLSASGPVTPTTPELSSATQQIIKQVNKFSGSGSLDDLEQITKHAMQKLYKLNPSSYQRLYKEIMSGKTKKQTPQDTTNVPAVQAPKEPPSFAAKRAQAAKTAQQSMTPKSASTSGGTDYAAKRAAAAEKARAAMVPK